MIHECIHLDYTPVLGGHCTFCDPLTRSFVIFMLKICLFSLPARRCIVLTSLCMKVRRIRFLGLFDTVNSVPKFEAAWMQRSKYPYTARSSAKVIRHAVAINERRAKFRQDLITSGQLEKQESRLQGLHRYDTGLGSPHQQSSPEILPKGQENGVEATRHPPLPVINLPPKEEGKEDFQDTQPAHDNMDTHSELAAPVLTRSTEDLAQPVMNRSAEDLQQSQRHDLNVPATNADIRRESMAEPMTTSMEDIRNHATSQSPKHAHPFHTNSSHPHPAFPHKPERLRGFSTQKKPQDIEEVWFPGCHADIGGGWAKAEGEKWQLSHMPLGKLFRCIRSHLDVIVKGLWEVREHSKSYIPPFLPQAGLLPAS